MLLLHHMRIEYYFNHTINRHQKILLNFERNLVYFLQISFYSVRHYKYFLKLAAVMQIDKPNKNAAGIKMIFGYTETGMDK